MIWTLPTVAFALGLAEAVGLVPVGARQGVMVYSREGAAPIELMADGDIDAPPDQVQAVLIDYGAHPRMIRRLVESRVLWRGESELFVYQRLELPVIADRDFTLHVKWAERGSKRLVSFRIENEHGPGPTSGVVRMSTLAGTWELAPIKDGTATRAIYHFQIDFAGSVPLWMVRDGAAKELPSLYEGIRRMVARRRLAAHPEELWAEARPR